jgi:mannose-6-phosphate isomerase-like protein (cupin superfamily)
MPTKGGKNEATVLSFSREKAFDGVHLARIALRKGENSAFHSHPTTRDTFFVMGGCLSIDIRVGMDRPDALYSGIRIAAIEPRHAAGQLTHRLTLMPGDVCVVEPGVVHCAMNLAETPCHFLCIEGVGEYDFIEV